jgi:hypothetical protein
MSSSSPQIIANVTPAAIASFDPALTICISNARDVSAAKINDVRLLLRFSALSHESTAFYSHRAIAALPVISLIARVQIIRRDGLALSW